nr:F-box only protein 5-like [Anolis sagrei ordinatus]
MGSKEEFYLYHGSPKIVSSRSEEKPIHNKENQQVSRGYVGSANDRGHEDSGYSFLWDYQLELTEHEGLRPYHPKHAQSCMTEHEDSTLLGGNINVTPYHGFSQRKNLLPVLCFEELVCSTLKNLAKVSTTWKKFLQVDNWALEMYNKALTLTSKTRKYTKVHHSQSNSSSSSFSCYTPFSDFVMPLKNMESLKTCYLCGSSAKYQTHLQRATCICGG